MDENIKVIKSKELSEQFEPRFIVVNIETGEILDDANGYGYKTIQKAYAGYAYKSRSRQQVSEIKRKEAAIFKWLSEHKSFGDDMDTAAWNGLKDGEELCAKHVSAMLDEQGYKDLPFTASELLRCWQRGKPQYRKKKH
jgi:hypothetical protein